MAIRMLPNPDDRPAKPAPAVRLPAGPRAPTILTTAELTLNGDAIETFVKAVGGREKLLAVLAICDTDSSSDKVVNCLLDDTYSSWSLRRICAYAGITVAELFATYKRALFAQAHIEAAHKITEKLVPIVEDVMARALPGTAICPRCNGQAVPDTAPCPQCAGTGKVETEPELPRQKLALELGRLIEHRAGVMVQQNAIAAGTGAAATTLQSGSLEQLQQVVGDLLFSPGRRRASAPQPPTIDVSPAEGSDAAPGD